MSNAPVKTESKAPSQIDVFKGNLLKYETDLKSLVAMHGISPEKFITTTINAVKKEPKLLECDPKTLFGAIMMSAELGLAPNTQMGLAFILPYNRRYKDGNNWQQVLEAQFQLGYQGWVEIMLRNPKIESVESGIIYSNEEWFYDKGKRDPFSHKPLPPSQRGEWIAAFALAWLKDSAKPKVVVLWKEDIEKVKKISKAANSEYSPWNKADSDPFLWMPRKTALKQLAKELPKTNEIEKVYHIDNVVETGGTVRLNEDKTVETVETTFMEDLSKQEKLETKSEDVAAGVKSMIGKKADASKLTPEEQEEYNKTQK